MNLLILIILLLILVPFRVEADATSHQEYPSPEYPNLQPSLVVVIGVLGLMSVISLVLLVYVKLCNRRESSDRTLPQNNTGLISSSSNRFSGIDKTLIESLPLFRFSSLKGSKEELECAVCLSKFDDVEVLRLLPKCRHAFHVNCIDHWLENHSSCPLCRQKVSSEDLKLITDSNSARFLWNNQSEQREDLNNIELFVEREESHGGSSRFGIGRGLRKIIHEKGHHKGEADIDRIIFHKHNHKIAISDFLFNNRWSNLSSSDLIFLNSAMVNDVSSNRFSSTDWNNDVLSTKRAAEDEETTKIKMKKSFESKVGETISTSDGRASTSSDTSRPVMNSGEPRSVSEITSFSRYGDLGVKNRIRESENKNGKEERTRRVWLPIARRTVQWFANREKRSSQFSKNLQRNQLDV